MTDNPLGASFDREALEAELARRIGKVNQAALGVLLSALGDPPLIDNLTNNVWQGLADQYSTAILPELERMFESAAAAMLSEMGIGVEWSLINERAAQWASTYGYNLIKDINAANVRQVQKAVESFYRQKWTLGDLKQKLQSIFGPVRAEMIAITETTRAASEGVRGYVEELRRQGAKLQGRINTSQDDRVCPICGPKDGKDPDVEGYPPYHISCRCWVGFEALPLDTL